VNILQGAIHPPLHYISERRLLGVLSERFGKPTIAFQLPEKPFPIEDPIELHDQHFVVSVSRISNQSDDPHTFWAPYIPDMNQWLGRAIRMRSNALRVEEDGFGIICPITEEHLEISAIPKLELAKRLFAFAGIKAHSSHPGRIATRLISQLGGAQGCRVLKIAGVRRLIKEHSALQEFGWDTAIQTIARGTADNPQPPFSEYEDLFIEPRSMTSKLTPVNVFTICWERAYSEWVSPYHAQIVSSRSGHSLMMCRHKRNARTAETALIPLGSWEEILGNTGGRACSAPITTRKAASL